MDGGVERVKPLRKAGHAGAVIGCKSSAPMQSWQTSNTERNHRDAVEKILSSIESGRARFGGGELGPVRASVSVTLLPNTRAGDARAGRGRFTPTTGTDMAPTKGRFV